MYDHPDKPLPAGERGRVVFLNYERSRDKFMNKRQREKFIQQGKSYRAQFDLQDDGSTSNLSVPLIKAHVDAFHARLVGMRPIIEVWPREPGDVARAAKQRMLIDYQWDIMRMLLHASMLGKMGLIYGIGWGKCTWRKEIRRRLVRRSFEIPSQLLGMDLGPFQGFLGGVQSLFGGSTLDLDDVAIWDNPWYENIPPDQVFPDPEGTDIDSCRYLIHRTKMSLDEVQAIAKGDSIRINRAAMSRLRKKLEKGSLTQTTDTTLMEEMADTFGGAGDSGLGQDETKRDFYLLEHWTDERVRWAVEDHEDIGLLRDEEHALGTKPFVRYTPEPLPNELIGSALTEDLYSINLEMIALKNARMDAVYRTVHPQVMIPRGSATNPAHIRFKAGGHFYVDPHNPPQIFQYPEMNFAVYREMADLRQMAEEIGGTRTFRGLQGEGDTTATEASLLAQASGTKFGAMLQQMNEQPFKRLGRLLIRLNDLNLTDERVVRVLGEEMGRLLQGNPQPGDAERAFVAISPQDLATPGNADLDVTIDVASKDPDTRIVKQRRAIEAFQALAQASQFDPTFAPLAHRMGVVMAQFIEEIPDPEALIRQGQQQAAMMQQQQLQAQALGNLTQGQRTNTEGGQLAADQGASGLPS